MAIHEWVVSERPREMLAEKGADNLSTSKLLAIILRTGNNEMSAEELARSILNKYGSIRNLDSVSISELRKIKGIGLAKATQIKSALELGKRMHSEESTSLSKIRTANDAVMYAVARFGSQLSFSNKEHFCVIFLNRRNVVIGEKVLTIGTSMESCVNPREVLKEAIELDASSIILVHNHPSGDVNPSDDDLTITENLKKAAGFMDICVLDHVIIGKSNNAYYSFRSNGKALQ